MSIESAEQVIASAYSQYGGMRNIDVLRMRQEYPLEWKIDMTAMRLKEYVNYGTYISFSGGKDSMVLLDIARRHKVNIKPVFIDTGLEYPEVRKIGYKYAYEVIKPKMTFKQVLDTYGYPVISKSQAMAIRKLRTQNLSDKYRNKLLYGDERGTAGKLSDKWHYLLNAPFKISEQCCDVMKKRPAYQLEKEHGIIPITAEMADESLNRQNQYVKHFCFSGKKLTPMGFWTEQDVLEYIYKYEVPIASVYGDVKKDWLGQYYLTGVQRTGCIFCMFGVHLEPQPNRFQQMYHTHPKLYNYCINKLELGKVLNYLGVEYRPCGTLTEQEDGQFKII